jgi:tetratricopeptide (TPR) repeat protein
MKTARLLCFVAGALALILVACSENRAVRSRYEAEKLFFQAERTRQGIRIRPDLITPAVSQQLRTEYDAALQYCYHALDSVAPSAYPTEYNEISLLAFRAATRLSQLSYAEKRFDSSITVLRGLMKRVSLSGLPDISVHLNLGRSLQANGRWDTAMTVYSYTVDHFYPPLDENGEVLIGLFNLPNRIYDGLVKVGDTAGATAQAVKAENYYRRLIADYPGNNTAGVSHLNLAGLYEKLGRYHDAVTELSNLTDTTGGIATPAYLRIASLHAGQLGRPDLALEEYDRILSRLKGRDTLQRPLVLYNKGLILMSRKEYDQARQVLVDVKRSYPLFYNQMPDLQYAIARTFELQDRQDRAETEYRFLMSNFPGTEQSLSTYLYLIEQYRKQGRDIEAERLNEQAEKEYDEIAATRPNTRAAAAALSYKAELYRQRQDWGQAYALLSQVFDKYPASEIGFRAAIVASVILRDNLNNTTAADSLIQVLKRRLTTVDENQEM